MSVFFNSVFLFYLIFYSFLSQNVDEPFFCASKNKRSETERAKDALHSLGDGGLCGTEQEKNMFYTYILRSISHPEQRYIGSTSDLKSRLAKHNTGEVPHTSKFEPWKVEAYFAFETKEKLPHLKPISKQVPVMLSPTATSEPYNPTRLK